MIGVPDREWGEAITSVCVLQRPKDLVLVEDLPRPGMAQSTMRDRTMCPIEACENE